MLLLSLLLIRPASAQPSAPQQYVIAIGAAADRLASGTLWLYSDSWYGVQQFKLAAIENGLAVVPQDIDRLKREANPHPNTDAYVIVIQAGEHVWFRTPDIPPDKFWADLTGALGPLGNTTRLPTGEFQVVLNGPIKRHITFLYPDGRPKANLVVSASIYLSDHNHCGFHQGLPLGVFRTDAQGTIEVVAPLVPLYFAGLDYYTPAGTGPAGPAYTSNVGMKIPADETFVVKVAWAVPAFTAQLQLLTATGRPRPNVDVYVNWSTNTCGGADRIAGTDGKGIVQLHLDATITGLTLIIGGPYSGGDAEGDRNTRRLSDAELSELFSKHKLVIRWDPMPRQVPPMLARPLGYWTSAPVNCGAVSGKWADPENGGTWDLSQTGESISGSLTILKGYCGSVTWQVAGRMNGRVATLTATKPEPPVDKCGAAAAASITAARAPYCNTAVPR
ncbi:MAG: hypothetical protein C5B51_09330 [Terriglobia bacterium]|nr:MAG: hypothetical protein C5B51_09330 [Terriglobia bacterium]